MAKPRIIKRDTPSSPLNVCRSHAPLPLHARIHTRARARASSTRSIYVFKSPRARRVRGEREEEEGGRLLAFLIEPFILALAYARTAPAYRICDTPGFVQERAYTHSAHTVARDSTDRLSLSRRPSTSSYFAIACLDRKGQQRTDKKSFLDGSFRIAKRGKTAKR